MYVPPLLMAARRSVRQALRGDSLRSDVRLGCAVRSTAPQPAPIRRPPTAPCGAAVGSADVEHELGHADVSDTEIAISASIWPRSERRMRRRRGCPLRRAFHGCLPTAILFSRDVGGQVTHWSSYRSSSSRADDEADEVDRIRVAAADGEI
jgi:hypothetical protein